MLCSPQSCHFIPELRAEVDIIEQMSSSSGSSSSDSESSSGSDDDSSSSGGEDNGPASPLQPAHQQPYNIRPAVANGTSRPQGSSQLMNTLSKCALPFSGFGAVGVAHVRPEVWLLFISHQSLYTRRDLRHKKGSRQRKFGAERSKLPKTKKREVQD